MRDQKADPAQPLPRLRDGTPKSIETSAILLDTFRDSSRSTRCASIAIRCWRDGLLRDSRLKADDAASRRSPR